MGVPTGRPCRTPGDGSSEADGPMFVPRTLAQTEGGPARAAWLRALTVGLFLTVALFAVLSFSLGSGGISLTVGEVAQSDIRAPRAVTFVSESQTEADRRAAAEAVQTVYEPIAPIQDIREAQLHAYDEMASIVSSTLERRNDGELTTAEVVE